MTITMTSPSRSVLWRGLIAILACLLWLLFAQNVAWASATNEITGNGGESGPLFAEVTGKVTDEAGKEIEEIRVTAYRLLGDPAIENPRWKPVASTTTDTTGAYRISLPVEPTYRISFSDMSATPQYVTEFYPDSVAAWQGADITFVQGMPVSGIDAQLAVGAVVLGHVTNNAGASLSDINAQAYKMVDDGSGNVTWSQFSSTEVDEQGKYTLTFAYSGTVRVSFYDFRWPAIYPGEYYDNVSLYEFSEELPKNIEARIGEIVSGVDAQLDTFGLISGRVTDKHGAPLQGVFVQAYVLYTNTYGTASWVGGGPGSISDANGYYTQPVQIPGIAHICFSGIGEPLEYLPTCFGGNSNDPAGGTDFSVSVNSLVENINIQLARTSRLVGQLTDQGGNPIGGGTVVMYAVEPPQPVFYMAYADELGRYTHTLPAGTFKVAASSFGYEAEWHENKSSYEEADLLTVPVESDTQVNFQLASKGSISGHVVDENGSPLPGISIIAYQKVGDGDSAWQFLELNGAQTDFEGKYSLRNLDIGTYRIRFIGGSGYAEEYYNDSFIFKNATDIPVARSESVQNIDAQMELLSHLAGRVTNEQGQPLPNIDVALYQYADNDNYQGWIGLGAMWTDSDGRYTFPNIAPGDYRISFNDWSGQYASEYYNNAGSLETATTISLPRPMSRDDLDVQLRAKSARLTIILNSNPNSRLNVEFSDTLGSFKMDDPTIDDGDAYTNVKTFMLKPGTLNIDIARLPEGRYVTNVICIGVHPDRWSPNLTMGAWLTLFDTEDATCTFTVERGVNIRGMVYHDRNGNGARNRDEPWLPGWSTYVFRTDGSMRMDIPTNDVGRAEYNLLPPGQYTICAVMQEGWSNSQPGTLDPTQQQPCYTLDMPAVTGATMRFGMIHANSASYRGLPSESADGVEIVVENEEIDEEEPSDEEVIGKNAVFLPLVIR